MKECATIPYAYYTKVIDIVGGILESFLLWTVKSCITVIATKRACSR